jgi:hypothetical protein
MTLRASEISRITQGNLECIFAFSAVKYYGRSFNLKDRPFCDGAFAQIVKIVLDALTDKFTELAYLKSDGENLLCFILLGVLKNDLKDTFCYRQFVHFLGLYTRMAIFLFGKVYYMNGANINRKNEPDKQMQASANAWTFFVVDTATPFL